MKSSLRHVFLFTVLFILFFAIIYVYYQIVSWSQLQFKPTVYNTSETNLVSELTPPQAPQVSPSPVLSHRIVEYHISVKLDPEQKTLEGQQTLTWKNPSDVPVQELYFHLYPNAFMSKKTTFNVESGGKLRNDVMSDRSFGKIDVHSIKTSAGQDLSDRLQFVQPDDANKHDQTVARLRLDQPVQPGSSLTLEMKFHVQLPEVYARMGYSGDFIMAGQWFPKIAVLEPKLVRNRAEAGWNIHQYHGNSEFYSNFGIYNVKIEVPKDYIVAATGFQTQPVTAKENRLTYHYYADDVHDFAWAASPDFIYVENAFSAPEVPGVKIKLYLDPKHEHLADRYIHVIKQSLLHFSKWYGRYPYATLSVVVPPPEGNGAGGMEYPTFITAWAADTSEPGMELERVVAHEIAHQWFYGMIANNEFEEPWLDEGFTSYAEDRLMQTVFDVQPNLALEASYVTSPASLNQFAWKYDNHQQYADNVYIRSKLILVGIEQKIGSEKMEKALKTYANRWRFKHPTTEDFQRSLEETTGTSWQTYFDEFVYDGKIADYSIDAIEHKRLNDGNYENTVVLTRRGGTYSVVPIVFHFQDGSTMKGEWDGKETPYIITLKHPSKLDYVQIDPTNFNVLDHRKINNFLQSEVEETWKIRWQLGVTKTIESFMRWVVW